MNQAERIEQFCHAIWQWYSVHKRTLPWRDLSDDDANLKAYKILVSEIMLQQTQVSRVEVKWKQWLRTFPTLSSVAAATNAEVIQVWQGMGYNSRALRLRDAALQINKQGSMFPKEMTELLTIKGIGAYTAAAIRNFAFGVPTACIDTNIRRIIHRTFYGPETKFGEWKKSDKQLLELTEKILTIALNKKFVQKYESSWQSAPTAEWHAALMDYGSLVCTKLNPKWDVSPLAQQEISKAAYKVPKQIKTQRKEPGRVIAGRFVPNRIIRGRIVEALREHQAGLTAERLGPLVCIDWNAKQHKQWLQGLLNNLVKDELIQAKNSIYTL